MRRLLLNPGLLGAVVFITLGCLFLPYPGIQTDEALFGPSIYSDYPDLEFFAAFKHRVPVMLMSYVGALKTWIYWVIFQFWRPGVWSIRLPMVLAGGLTIFLFASFLERLLGRRAAWIGTLLLATDVSHVLTTTCDWGPVALQHLLLVASGYLLVRFEDRALGPAAFLLGLALWNKAIVLWTFAGLGVALLTTAWPTFRRFFTVKNAAASLLGFAAGSFLFWRYNVRQPWASFSGNATMGWEQVRGKWVFVEGLLNGSNVMGYLVVDPAEPLRLTFGVWLIGAAVLLTLLLPRRTAWFPLVAAIVTWLMMALTKGAGGAAHHAVLLCPFPQWMAAAAFTHPRIGRVKWLPVVLAALLAADNLRLYAVHLDYARRFGSPQAWTGALHRFPERVRAHQPKLVLQHDWGLQDNLILLSENAVPLRHVDRPFAPEVFAEDALWTGWTQGFEVFAGVNKDLDDAARRAGYRKALVEVISDEQGHPAIELFRFERVAGR